MSEIGTDPTHFTKAVTELGEKRPVVTTQAIFNDRGVKIIDKGVAVNAGLYERLMAHKLTVPLEQSVGSTPTVTGPLLRAHAEQAMREVSFLERLCAVAKTRGLLLDALEKIPLPEPMAFQLLLACEVRPELFRHSIHMALFAAWMTLGPLVSRFDIGVAAAAGLLHDIGMLHLDPSLLVPQELIGSEQRRQLYAHPLVAAALIERHHEYPREMLRAITEHHEFLDGSGYPRNLSRQAISPLACILSLSELVTSMLAPERQAPELRLWVQLRMNRHRYDATLVERVEQHLQPQSEPQRKGLTLLADPLARLLEINASVAEWPTELSARADSNALQREGMAAVAHQAAQLRRTLASVGVAPEQLKQLGGDALDDFLQLELTLLAQEAAWQLRTLTRQTKQRWRLEPDAQYPQALQLWLDQADALVASIYSASPSDANNAE